MTQTHPHIPRMYNSINILAKYLPRPRNSLIDAERNRRALDQLLALLRTGQSYAMTGVSV